MTKKTTPSNAIEKIIDDTISILQQIEEIPRMRDASLDEYQTLCRRMPGHIRKGRLKIAVVGVIKSGKSTFVNSLAGKEVVKRGAGVMTSITTRIRKGKKNRASLYFKSWDEINSQLQNALVLFPGDGSENDMAAALDIRRKKDRDYLKKAYQSLSSDSPVDQDEIRPETLLIRHALKGFDDCKDLVQADETVLCFESKEFDRHKTFTADPGKAFYIRDVCLEVFGRMMDPHIEIADCQGADSTDPAQLSQILSYLESSNLMVYCISSRTGLRQADMTFLTRIKNLGLLDNILFVNNCDLNEHDHLSDLIKIEESIQENLRFLEISPKLFSFSSLYNLFLKLESKLTKKDLGRLRLWQEEKEMVQYSDRKTSEFTSFFQQAIDKNRHDLLISNHLKRLGIILSQLDLRTRIFLDLLSSDRQKETAAAETLKNLNQNASRLEAIVSSSMAGAVKGLENEIESNVKHAFDRDEQGILKKTREFIGSAAIDVEQYRSFAKESGFNQILYFMFQDFKRRLDLYVVESVTPRLKQIVEAQEDRIISYFKSLFDSYQIDLLTTDQYPGVEQMADVTPEQGRDIDPVDIDKIKKILGLQVPKGIFEAKYTPRIKANVFAGFSLQTLSQMVSAMLNRTSDFSFSTGLKKAAEKIKKENQRVITEQFQHYHTRLRTHYFLPLIEAAAREFKEKINQRFIRYHSFKEEIDHLFSLKQSEKKEQKNKVMAIREDIQRVSCEIASYAELPWK